MRTFFSGALLLLMAAPVVEAQLLMPEPRVMMNLAAHPDDEDALTMAHYRRAMNAVVHSVIYTRGEGGQNEIGPELYASLGAIRTAETLAAAGHYGVQVRFLNFDDFGYSKRAAETFANWGGEDAVTERLVYFVRKLKPDVVFTNHDTLTVGPRTQHGHHQAVGRSAYRAMTLSADPDFHPEHLQEEGLDLWQPQRLFIRHRGGETRPDVSIPVGDIIPTLDESPADIAVRGVAEHRSQGFDHFAPRFRQDSTHFVLLWSAEGAPPLPAGAEDLAAGLPLNPFAIQADLAHWIDAQRLAGARVSTSAPTVVPGEIIDVEWDAGPDRFLRLSGAVEGTFSTSPASVTIPHDARPTAPATYAQYDRHVSHPPIQSAVVDGAGNVFGAAHLPVEIVPPVVLEIPSAVAMPRAHSDRILLDDSRTRLPVSVAVNDGDTSPIVLHASIFDEEDSVADANAVIDVHDGIGTGEVVIDLSHLSPGRYEVELTARRDGSIEPTATLSVEGRILPNILVPDGLRVGLVRSYDDATEAAMREMGAEVILLDSLALATGAFDDLHTIVVDIRGYLVREDLRAHNERLLNWVRNGGHLVVTYQKTFEWNEGLADPFIDGATNPGDFPPYPLVLGRDRVTDQHATVTPLIPHHPIILSPNPLTGEDWDGWTQERGLYFPASYDERYVELFEMADPGEPPLQSSTLIADVGEGTYLFSALGWYRQLGTFVPGAYRAFANIISLPLADADDRAGTER